MTFQIEVNLDKQTQTLDAFVRELKKVNPDLCSRMNGNIALNPRIIQIDAGYNTRFEGFDSPEEYFAVPANRAYLERLKAAYRGEPETTTPPAIRVEIIDSKAFNRDGASRLFALSELHAEGFEVLQIAVEEFKGDEISRDNLLLDAQAGSPFSQLALGAVLARLKKRGITPKKIAEQRNIVVNTVNNLIEGNDLPRHIKRWIADGTISHTLAIETVRKFGIEKSTQMIEEAIVKRTAELKAADDERRQKEEEKQRRLAEQNSAGIDPNNQADSGDNLQPDDEVKDGVIVLDGESGEGNQSKRALLRPKDLKPKAFPKKLAESFHNSLLDMASLDDEERVWVDESTSTVTIKMSAEEFQKLKKMREDSVTFDNENIKRLGGTMIEGSDGADSTTEQDSHENVSSTAA